MVDKKRLIIADVWQLVAEAVSIHSDAKLINEDFTLSDLQDYEKKYIRQQMKIATIMAYEIKKGANIENELWKRKHGKDSYVYDEQTIKKMVEDSVEIVLIDGYIMTNFSKANKGRLIQAVVQMAEAMQSMEQPTREDDTKENKLTKKVDV